MLNFYQKTIKKEVNLEGVGLHNGKSVKVKLIPAPPNHGIIFKRVDLKDKNLIPALFNNVSKTVLCTTIQNDFGIEVSTTEHLLGALYGNEIDNLLIEINSNEMPIMDGSAKYFINAIKKVGIKTYDTTRKFIKVNKKCEILKDNKLISIEPSEQGLQIDFRIIYNNQLIGDQKSSVNLMNDNLDEIYNSRTFCLYEDVEKIKEIGLAKGGSLDNAIVVKDDKILNEDGLRFENEFVKHKILDCIGDLMLSGHTFLGHIKCEGGGHLLTNELLRKFFSNRDNFSLVEYKMNKLPKSAIYSDLVAVSA